MTHILITDDDPDVLASVQRVLERESYEVTAVSRGEDTLSFLAKESPDLIILDIIMPDMSGIEVCKRIRANPYWSHIPIIFLTAKGRPTDIVQGLDAGGDDYVIKPFQVMELPARVRALLRRASNSSLDAHPEYLQTGDLRLHINLPQVAIGDQVINLTPMEHHLLRYLMTHAGRPISSDTLIEEVWGYLPGTGDPGIVRVHVQHLRQKIEPDPSNPRYVHNIHGEGYLIKK